MNPLLFVIISFSCLFHHAISVPIPACIQPVYIYSAGSGAYLTSMPGGGLATLSSIPSLNSLFCLIQAGSGGTIIETSDGTLTLQESLDINSRLAVFLNPGTSGEVIFNVEQQLDQLNYFFETNNYFLQTTTYNSQAQVIINLQSDSRQDWQIYDQTFTPIAYTPTSPVNGNGQPTCNPFYLFNRGIGQYLEYPINGGMPYMSNIAPQNPNFCFDTQGELTNAAGPILILQQMQIGSNTLVMAISSSLNLQFMSNKVDLINYVFTANQKTIQTDWSGDFLWANPTHDSREQWQAYDAGFTPITYPLFP
jgi:hypothetical protein